MDDKKAWELLQEALDWIDSPGVRSITKGTWPMARDRAALAKKLSRAIKSASTPFRKPKTTHGMYNTPTYRSWSNMMCRCTNPKTPSFANYGGRGIKVCSEWYTFSNFLLDMGERPDGMTLDRVDPNGDYTPKNCQWADVKAQARNTRNRKEISFVGEAKSIAEWADDARCVVSRQLLATRVRHGWDFHKAMTTQSQRRNKAGA